MSGINSSRQTKYLKQILQEGYQVLKKDTFSARGPHVVDWTKHARGHKPCSKSLKFLRNVWIAISLTRLK